MASCVFFADEAVGLKEKKKTENVAKKEKNIYMAWSK